MIERNKEWVNGAYKTICRQEKDFEIRLALVSELEKALNTNFKDTKDFHYKVQSFLEKGKAESIGSQIIRKRKKLHFSREDLAKILKINTKTLRRYETDKRQPPTELLEWLYNDKTFEVAQAA